MRRSGAYKSGGLGVYLFAILAETARHGARGGPTGDTDVTLIITIGLFLAALGSVAAFLDRPSLGSGARALSAVVSFASVLE